MTETKQLVVVVKGTAAMASHWETIRPDYLDKIIRSFCGDNHPMQTGSPIAELTLIIFNAHGPSSGWLVQRSGWTKDVEVFMNWLRGIDFGGDGSRDVAIAEGLGEVLTMFPGIIGSHNLGHVRLQKHCIIVAANNPNPKATPVYTPPSHIQPMCIFRQSGSHLSDAVTVAKSFPQCLVSLSVISPRNLPKLRTIYNVAQRKPSQTDAPIENVENAKYLVLISGCFNEARAALNLPQMTNLPSNQGYLSGRGGLNNNSMSRMMTSSGQSESATLAMTSSTMPTNVVNDNVATNVGSVQGAKLWEGDLMDERQQGPPVFIARLIAYRHPASSESLADDWPQAMQIDNVVPEDCRKNEIYLGKVDYLIFRVRDELRVNLQKKKLYIVIKLPSQKLLLCASNVWGCLHGILVPKEMAIYIYHNPPQVLEL